MAEPNFRALCAELKKLAYRHHYTCEDSWYSCPKADGGSANISAGSDCDCGADEHNARVDAICTALAALAQPEPQGPSLKKEALEELRQFPIDPEGGITSSALDKIRRALESLPND